MARLEELTRGAQIKGILPDGLVTVVDVQWHGAVAVELTYKDAAGRLGNELLFRDREPTLEVLAAGRLWNFDADGALLRLVSESYRIRLAYLFDPRLAVHTSLVEPLPHQITAVYGEMLTHQPLRFQLADDDSGYLRPRRIRAKRKIFSSFWVSWMVTALRVAYVLELLSLSNFPLSQYVKTA